MEKGLIHIYCGDGKGKTTAAMGLAMRSSGRGFKVLIVQFLKSQDTGELHSLEKLPEIMILRGNRKHGFTFNMSEEEKELCRVEYDKTLNKGIEICKTESIDLLVLDEVIGAYNLGFINRDCLLDFLKNKPEKLEVVLTGRNPDESLLGLADYVSEIRKVKHPFDRGIKARNGIER
ncbi:MAG: cob(I)yrinic acid a,c-diamide adenosyltransferase [Eubacteriales bacterium]